MAAPDLFRRQCRLLRAATLFVFVVLCLVLAIVGFSTAWTLGPGRSFVPPDSTDALLLAVRMVPGLAYLWAVWAVQRALADLGAGRLFHPTVARAMRHIGVSVLAGALFSVFGVTNVSRLVTGGAGGYAYLDLSGIVLGVVGAALVLMARLVDQARALQAELDDIF